MDLVNALDAGRAAQTFHGIRSGPFAVGVIHHRNGGFDAMNEVGVVG